MAAICGATAGLARAGLLDERAHTSAAAEYLAATGYAGGDHYVDARAVVDGDLITAGPQSPVQFARATLRAPRPGVERTLDAYEAVFHAWRPRRVPGAHAGQPRERPGRRPRPGPSRPPQSEAGALLTDVILTTFRLNGRLMEVAQEFAAEGGITAAWWQVLGGILDEPRTVAEIGRRMGMTRQGVQRVADLLVERGLAEYRPNPAHRRAKLLACTEAGYWAIRQISLAVVPWANRIGAEIGADELREALATTRRLVDVLERDSARG